MAKVTSVRLSAELAARLERLAASVDRPRSWLIERAIARYVEEETWQVAAVTEALDEYRAGQAALHHHDEVMNRLQAKIRRWADDADPISWRIWPTAKPMQ